MSEAAEVGQAKRGISRSVVPRVLNALMWLVFCGMAGVGLLLAFRLPPGSRGGARLTALGWVRHDWGDVHTWLSYVFLALIAAQLGEARVAAGGGDRRSAGLVLMMWLALQPVEKRGGHGDGRGRDRPLERVRYKQGDPTGGRGGVPFRPWPGGFGNRSS